jgi:hypothetical protein
MVGRIFIPLLLAGSFMVVAAGEPANPRIHTSGEVENLPGYQDAPVSKLVAAAKPPEKAPPEEAEIAEAIRKTIGDRAKSLGKAYGMDMSGDLNVGASGLMISVGYRDPGNALLSLDFNRKGNQVIHALVQDVRLEDAATPDLLEKRYTDFHRRAFGFDPPAVRPAGDRIRVERSIKDNFAEWRITVDGALVGAAMIRAMPNPGDGRWTILGTPCPTSGEVKEIADWLQKEPTRITEEEAVAIAWKNWKAVRSAADGDADYQITGQLRKGTKEEREPWGVYGCIHGEPKAWKNMAAFSDSPDPVFHEVQFTKNFYTVSVLVDRMDGKVIRIHEGQRGW